MEVHVVDEKQSVGNITIASGAVEHVLPRDYFLEIPLNLFQDQQQGVRFNRSQGEQDAESGPKAH